MKRSVVIIIGVIVAITLMIMTGVVVHKERSAKGNDEPNNPIDSETLLAPPAGLDEDEILDFYNMNATQEEYMQFEDGKEVVEEQLGSCPRITTTVTTDRYACYLAISSRCKYPCKTIIWTVGVTSDYRLKYQCSCV